MEWLITAASGCLLVLLFWAVALPWTPGSTHAVAWLMRAGFVALGALIAAGGALRGPRGAAIALGSLLALVLTDYADKEKTRTRLRTRPGLQVMTLRATPYALILAAATAKAV